MNAIHYFLEFILSIWSVISFTFWCVAILFLLDHTVNIRHSIWQLWQRQESNVKDFKNMLMIFVVITFLKASAYVYRKYNP